MDTNALIMMFMYYDNGWKLQDSLNNAVGVIKGDVWKYDEVGNDIKKE